MSTTASEVMQSSAEKEDDPFELEDQSRPIRLLSMLYSLMGVTGLCLYAIWLLRTVVGNFGGFLEAEISALATLTAILTGAATPTILASAGAAAGLVAISVISVVYQWKIEKVWRRKVKREWRWVWKNLTSSATGLWGVFDKFVGAVGAVLTLVESVYYVAITIATPVIAVVNIWVLVSG